jgi:SPASM domain peptide maturase of grasp-with-spasm system
LGDVFKLIQNCIPVKGINQSIICDLQRNAYDIIPNDLYEILVLQEGKTLTDVKGHFENKYDDIIDEYFEFLLKKEYVFFTDTPDWFPKLKKEWNYPFGISNAILDIDKNSKYNIFESLKNLEEINCKHIEFRFYNLTSLKTIEKIILFLDEIESIITSVGVAIPDISGTTKNDYQILIKTLPRISYIIVHSSESNEFIKPIRGKTGYIIFSKDKLVNEKCCGVISSNYFISNIKNFTESLKHNSCLNRKISIDVNGEIKNCPSMPKSFGNIKDTTLQEALEKKDFKKYWNITKDQIDVCKDCEFRYVCTDCRAYTEDPEDDYSKPLKCGYSPYTNVWEEWSTNPLKQKAIEYYGMQDLVKKNDQ